MVVYNSWEFKTEDDLRRALEAGYAVRFPDGTLLQYADPSLVPDVLPGWEPLPPGVIYKGGPPPFVGPPLPPREPEYWGTTALYLSISVSVAVTIGLAMGLRWLSGRG